jgi:hypothetical protein
MFSGHYDDWIKSRMNGINEYISPEYFKSKTLLELGCGHAHIGNKFHELGADVTSSDARMEHLEIVNDTYPHIKTYILDADKDDIPETYDIILHWGLLYHLNEIENHLAKISQKCDVLLLETEVCDSDDSTFFITTNEEGYDQAFNGTGIRPSPAYVEKVLEKNGFQFRLVKDSILNSGFHSYDWDVKNTNTCAGGLRRFWICWKKDVESPLK